TAEFVQCGKQSLYCLHQRMTEKSYHSSRQKPGTVEKPFRQRIGPAGGSSKVLESGIDLVLCHAGRTRRVRDRGRAQVTEFEQCRGEKRAAIVGVQLHVVIQAEHLVMGDCLTCLRVSAQKVPEIVPQGDSTAGCNGGEHYFI